METLLPVEEAAQNLNLNVDTIRRWLRDGTLKGRKLGRVWRILESELQRLVSTASTAVAPASL